MPTISKPDCMGVKNNLGYAAYGTAWDAPKAACTASFGVAWNNAIFRFRNFSINKFSK